MKVNSITRVILCSILCIFSSPTLLNSVLSSSVLDERTDRPRTAREKHSGKLLVRDPSTNTRQRPVPVLRIRGRTPTRGAPGEDHLPTFTRLPDVAVTCSRSGFVLRVKRNFYGFSAAAEELTLGETCKSNGVLEPQNDLLFTYALNDCQGEQQVSVISKECESVGIYHCQMMTCLISKRCSLIMLPTSMFFTTCRCRTETPSTITESTWAWSVAIKGKSACSDSE